MSTPDDPGLAPQFEALMTHAERFEIARRNDPALARAELEDLIRVVVGKQAVIAGRFGETPAIFRIFEDPANPLAAKEWDELQRIYPLMQEPPYQVVRPLYFSKDNGIQITEKVPGTPLMEHLWQLPRRKRLLYLPQSAAWLHSYMGPTLNQARANPLHWLRRAEKIAAQQPFPRLQRCEAAILIEMKRLARQIKGKTWRRALGHGDYHPNNLIATASGLTGIDTGARHMVPIYRDMARFMLHIARRGLTLSRAHHFGVDKSLFDAFATTFELDDTEQQVYLPMLLGFDALTRVESKTLPRRRIKRAHEIYEMLLEDMRKTAPE